MCQSTRRSNSLASEDGWLPIHITEIEKIASKISNGSIPYASRRNSCAITTIENCVKTEPISVKINDGKDVKAKCGLLSWIFSMLRL